MTLGLIPNNCYLSIHSGSLRLPLQHPGDFVRRDKARAFTNHVAAINGIQRQLPVAVSAGKGLPSSA